MFLSRSISVSLSSSRLNFSLLSRPNTWPKHESVSLLPSSLLLAYSCPSWMYQPHYLRLQSIFSDSRLKRDRHARQNGGKRQPTKFESSLPLLAFVLPLPSFLPTSVWLFSSSGFTRSPRSLSTSDESYRRCCAFCLSPLVPSSSDLNVSSFNYDARRHVLPPSSTATRLWRENTTDWRAHGTEILARLHARVPAGRCFVLIHQLYTAKFFEILDMDLLNKTRADFLEQRILYAPNIFL